ncbi:MAG: LacI family DNA-binding transcriptional regulator [Planctomycetota bacterium]|jgi:DNA-binding LacI/PurR family transcriptional regulator
MENTEIAAAIGLDEERSDPLYKQIADGLRSLIASERIAPGDRLPTSAELAAALGVSVLTVDAGLKFLADEGLVVRRPRRGTFVSGGAPASSEKRKRKGSSGRIARPVQMVFCDIGLSDMYWLEVLRALEADCREHDFVVRFSEIAADQFDGGASSGFAEGAVGVVLCGYNSPAAVQLLREGGVPFVLIGDMADANADDSDVDIVANDDVERARQSTKHLLGLGHRTISCIVGPPGSRFAADLTTGYRNAMTEERLRRAKHRIHEVARHTVGEGRRIGEEILQGAHPPTAVFACDDRVAVGVMQAAKAWNFSVPADLGVVGVGNLEISEAASPKLTTSPDDPRHNAHIGFEKLMAQMGGGPHARGRTVVEAPGLLVRESTARVPGG